MLRQNDFIKSQVVLEAWRQASHYGGHRSMLMIACAIGNRVRSGWGSWLEVLAGLESTSAGDTPGLHRYGMPPLNDANFLRILQEIDDVYDNRGQDLANGGLYWGDMANITRPWFQQEILDHPEEHPRLANCGTLTFWG